MSGLNMMVAILNNKQKAMVGVKTKKPKLKIVGGDLAGSNQQDLDPTIHYITSVIVP